ncbi:MAG: hypothetical protein JW725_03825 [Candidatus Babeliaceae bacterium]|nr:hypothetical protein [Candidatus Babeliaceae bacterium]
MRFLRGIVLVLVSASLCGESVDNRFLVPLLDHKPLLLDDERCPFVKVQPWMVFSSRAIDCYGEAVGLFDYEQPSYTLREIDKSLIATGRTTESLFRTDWRGALSSGPYLMSGDMVARGVAFEVGVPILSCFRLGARGSLMGVRSNMRLFKGQDFDPVVMGPGDDYELRLLQERIHSVLGIESALWDRVGCSDIEIFGRLFKQQEYAYRCRYVDVGLSLGFVLPSGVKRDIDNPASIPFGGDGHTGIFLEGTLDAILRYDLRAGFLFRFQQRFPATMTRRVSYNLEPERFGAIVGPFEVRPGPTLAFAPYVAVENLREGFGAYVGYSLVKHFRDRWADCRADPSGCFADAAMRAASVWASEHLFCTVFYDFREGKHGLPCAPVLALSVDVPLDWVIARQSFKSYGVSLILEAYF